MAEKEKKWWDRSSILVLGGMWYLGCDFKFGARPSLGRKQNTTQQNKLTKVIILAGSQ